MSNTITAYFKGRIGVAESVYQNDYGIVMAFDSIDLPSHFDCYFSRLNQEEALPGLGADNRVTIPNSILANPGNVTIHIPLHTGENDSEVEYVVYFKVIGRARPIDDGTPTQMTAIERALALLSQPITNIEEIVNEALSFTGDTFAEMKQELADDFAEYKGDVDDDIADFKTEIRGDIADVEHDFDILDGQFQTAVAAITVDSEVQGIRTGDDGVTYTSAGEAVRKQFSDVKSEMNDNYMQFIQSDFKQGAWASATTWDNTTARICSKRSYPVKAGDKLVYDSGSLMIGFGLWVNGVLTEYHAWASVATTTEYVFEHDGDFFIQFKKSNDAAITTSEMDADCKLYKGISYRVSKIEDNVDTLEDFTERQVGNKKAITFSYSGNHSSDNDILNINVPSGTEYTVNLEATGGQTWCDLYYWSNGTKTKIASYTIASAFPLTLTASAGIDGFSLYWTGSSSGTVKMSVEYVGSLETSFAEKVEFIESCIDENEVTLILANGTPPNPSNADCVRTKNAIPVKVGDIVEFITDRPLSAGAAKYIFGVYGYDVSNNFVVNLSPTDRAAKSSIYLVDNPSVVSIRYAVTEYSSSNTVITLRASDFEGYSTTARVSGNRFENQYSGEKLSVNKGRYNAIKTSLFSPTITAMGSSAPQGFAIYNGNVIQLYSNADKAAIFDFSDGTVVATMASNVGHGNCIDFLNAMADGSDLFPIAIVGDGTTNIAYEVRIQTSGITVRKTLKFPTENAGYYVGTMVDKLNNILYTIGYVANSYTDATNNKMVIAKWDYSELTANGDGTYTPQFVEKFNVPFITTIQQPVFFNGKLHILSSKASNGAADTNIYVIDPYRKGITNVLSEFPSPIKNVETEAIYFYDDGTDVYMFIKNYESNVPYYKVVFNS